MQKREEEPNCEGKIGFFLVEKWKSLCQFHQPFTSSFSQQFPYAKIIQTQTVSIEKLRVKLLVKWSSPLLSSMQDLLKTLHIFNLCYGKTIILFLWNDVYETESNQSNTESNLSFASIYFNSVIK